MIIRTFVAIEMPSEVGGELRRLQDLLAPEAPTIRWVAEATGFHLTLAFLGGVPEADLATIGRVVAEVAARNGPLDLRLAGPGAFPNPSQARVVWAGLEGPGIDELRKLREETAAALATIGHGPADDRFTPHVTLGRARSRPGRPPDLREPLNRLNGRSGPDFRVSEVVVFTSRPGPHGPVYTPQSLAPLRGGKLSIGA